MSSVAEIPETLLASFSSAYWIWTPETDVTNPPAGFRAFRYTYTTPTGKNATSALILITVDNTYSLFVNSQYVGAPPVEAEWENAQIFNVAPLDPRSNLFAINGINVPGPTAGVNPAGVLCAVQIAFSDGTMDTFSSNGTWKSFGTVPAGFESLSTDDSTWNSSTEVDQYGSGPWGSKVILPTSVPGQMTVSLPNPIVSTTGSEITTASVPLPTSRRTASASATPITSDSKVNVGAIVGGVIGGLIILILIVFLIILLKRQKKMHSYGKKLSTESALASQHVDGTNGRPAVTPFSVPSGLPMPIGADVEMSENGRHDNMGYINNGSISGHEHTNRWVHGLNGGWTETISFNPQQEYHKGPIVHLDGSRYLDPNLRDEIPPTYQSVPRS